MGGEMIGDVLYSHYTYPWGTTNTMFDGVVYFLWCRFMSIMLKGYIRLSAPIRPMGTFPHEWEKGET
jgi:hypothetical protein